MVINQEGWSSWHHSGVMSLLLLSHYWGVINDIIPIIPDILCQILMFKIVYHDMINDFYTKFHDSYFLNTAIKEKFTYMLEIDNFSIHWHKN